MAFAKIYGLIGYPVKHSLSAAMHNAAFRSMKINARYRLFELKPEELAGFLGSLKERNIRGLNVTIPYKEKAIPYLNGYRSAAVRVIGAVNTIVAAKDGRLKGFNTDYLGFSRHIAELGLKPKKIALIGAGGAARAVCFALARGGAEEIFICDIDKYKSLSLARRFQDFSSRCRFLSVARIEDLEIQDKDMLINASPVGLRPEDPCLVGPGLLSAQVFVYDLIYNPQETPLLRLAKEQGCRYANGLAMLLYQGAESLGYWVPGRKAPVEVMRQALVRKLSQ